MAAGKYIKFLAVGLPAFLLAVPLNYLLVEFAGFDKRLAYALVLCFQVSLNFVMCKLFVFENKVRRSLAAQFAGFFGGIIGFRVLDWLLYVFLVEVVGVYYLLVQIMNVLIFSVAKFLFARILFEGYAARGSGTGPGSGRPE